MRALFIKTVGSKAEEIRIADKQQIFFDQAEKEIKECLEIAGKLELVVDSEGRLQGWSVSFSRPEDKADHTNRILIRDAESGISHVTLFRNSKISEHVEFQK